MGGTRFGASPLTTDLPARQASGGYPAKACEISVAMLRPHEVMKMGRDRVLIVGAAGPFWTRCDPGIDVAPRPWVPDQVRKDGYVWIPAFAGKTREGCKASFTGNFLSKNAVY